MPQDAAGPSRAYRRRTRKWQGSNSTSGGDCTRPHGARPAAIPFPLLRCNELHRACCMMLAALPTLCTHAASPHITSPVLCTHVGRSRWLSDEQTTSSTSCAGALCCTIGACAASCHLSTGAIAHFVSQVVLRHERCLRDPVRGTQSSWSSSSGLQARTCHPHFHTCPRLRRCARAR